MDGLLSEFLTDTAESLDVIDVELVRFESCADDKATLNNIFRLVHTIKGTCGFIGLPRLESLAHAGETLLGKFRDGALDVTPEAVTLVLASIDRIKSLLSHLADSQAEPAGDDRDLIARLEDAAGGGLQSKLLPPIVAKVEAPVAVAELGDDNGRWDADQGRYLRPGEVSLADLEAAFRAADGPEVREAKPAIVADQDADRKAGPGASTIRVNVEVLESMMTMVSELVLTRNQLMQMLRATSDSEFKTPLQRLSGITAELQDCVMKTRMQHIGSAWKKLPRIVRDAGQDLAKKIDLVMEGEATELDRQVLELIKDSLTHMIRNSCDHGVETPTDRAAKSKSENGTIKLRAYHEGGHIIIEVSDDGTGLNTERIRAKALKTNVIDAAEAMSMTDAQIHRLIFAPGFSTAAKVTNISGRGVGMDVVKKQRRADQRHDRPEIPPGSRNDLHHQDPADSGDHFRAYCRRWRASLRHAPAVRSRTRAGRQALRTQDRADQRHACPASPRSPFASGRSVGRAEPDRRYRRTRSRLHRRDAGRRHALRPDRR